jgi:hypothetical protein
LSISSGINPRSTRSSSSEQDSPSCSATVDKFLIAVLVRVTDSLFSVRRIGLGVRLAYTFSLREAAYEAVMTFLSSLY